MMRRELLWGPIDLSNKPVAATEHFLVMGATGSGKSLLIKRLLRGAINPPPGLLNRALIYDPKQEMVSVLSSLGVQPGRVRILHPFDDRAYCWDMAVDIKTPIEARQLATTLIPDKEGGKGDGSFFTDACRDLLSGVILTLARCAPNPQSWTFRDVILAMLYQPYLSFILGRDKTREQAPFILNSRLRQSYLGDSDPKKIDWRTVSNIRATLNARLAVYEPIAAAWQRAYDGDPKVGRQPRRFSLAEWFRSDEVVVLGNDEAARAPLDAINRAMFKRITELLLSRKELTEEQKTSGDGLSWFFLDEVREAGELDGLGRLMTKGRTKGACVVLGFQDMDGMRDVYGTEVANEIVGQCAHVAILRLSSPTTAEWAASMFGSKLANLSSSTISQDGMQMGRSQSEAKNVYSEEILFLPSTSPSNGLTGYFKSSRVTRERMPFKQPVAWNELVQPIREGEQREMDPNFVPIEDDEQFLEPWTVADWRRLGFKGNPPDLGDSLGTKLNLVFKGMDRAPGIE